MADEGFLPMLHSYNQFKRPNGVFGMPRINREDSLREAAGVAEELKREDFNRQKELMQFQQQMQAQAEQRAMMNQALQRNERTVFGPNKQRIVQQAPLTSMQQKFRQEEIADTANKAALARVQAQEGGRLNTALATGKLRNEGLQSTALAAAERAEQDRASRELIASGRDKSAAERARLSRESAEKIAETSRNSVQVMIGPDGQPHAIASNPREGTAKELTIDGQPVGDVYNPGTRPKAALNPTQQKGIDLASDALGEIDTYLLKPDDSLTDEAAWATGGTAWTGYLPASKGRTGQAALNRVAAERILNVINHMKSQSKTGATGMGNMSNDDRKVLEHAATKIKDPWLDQEVIRAELVKVRNVLRKTTMIDNPSQPQDQSRFTPAGPGVSKLQDYAYTAGPNESASVPSYDQPGRANLPITSGTPAPPKASQVLTPDVVDFLRKQRTGSTVEPSAPIWQGGR